MRTTLNPPGTLSVATNGQPIFSTDLKAFASYAAGNSGIMAPAGSFGFGAWQDQAVHFRNVLVYDTTNTSRVLYKNPLTDADYVLSEFGTQANLESVCLDGPKRDRLVWLGDFYHTSRILPVSTGRFDHARGTLSFLLKTQLSNGQLSISPNMGFDPTVTLPFAPEGTYGLDDYQTLGFLSFYHYVRLSGDWQFARRTWPQWKKQLAWLQRAIDVHGTGLIHFNSSFLSDAQDGAAVSCSAVEALNAAVEVATGLECPAEEIASYRHAKEGLTNAVRNLLWDSERGTFRSSLTHPNQSSVSSTAFCITAGVASREQAIRAIDALDKLQFGVGYQDVETTATESDVKISPNTNGFLLPAILTAADSARANSLLHSLWGAMVHNVSTSSGASWEYVTPDGAPGLSRFTSLGHPWGGAPTYVLSEWAAGLRTADGIAGFGYASWVLSPSFGLQIGLTHASTTVPVFRTGGKLHAAWRMCNNGADISVSITAPSSSHGVFKLGPITRILSGQSHYSFVEKLPLQYPK